MSDSRDETNLSKVQRYDLGAVRSKPKRTQQGFLKLSANLTRTGVLKYKQSDGTVIRELRPSEEVFHKDSLESMESCPFTDLHPSEMVTAINVLAYQKGIVVAGTVKQDGKYMAGQVIVQDQELIDSVMSGERKEISPGYTCDIEMTSGVHNGEKYDCIQRNIRYNHVAIGGTDWGRSGPEVSIRLDSKDANVGVEHRDTFVTRPELRSAPSRGREDNKMKEIEIEGLKFEVSEVAAQAIEKALAKAEARADELNVNLDEAAKRADAIEAELDTTKAELEKAQDLGNIRAIAKARLDLEAKATKLGAEDKFDGLSDSEVRVAALTAKGISVEGKSEAYIEARFDTTLEAIEAVVEANEETEASAEAVSEALETVVEESREDAYEPSLKPWEMPINDGDSIKSFG